MLNLPNFLTLIRIAAIPLFLVLLISRHYTEALMVFIVGGITDALDGPLARLTGQQTSLGTYLDPLADKLLITSSLVVLTILGTVPAWFLILVVSRDIIISLGYGGIYSFTQQWMAVRPSIIGKINTFIQLLLITILLVDLYHSEIIGPQVPGYLFVVTALTTVISGLQYVYRGLVWLQNQASISSRLS